ncbi:MAG: insulinase family protein [SAR324 cluster bacterium]|nr:insulinase family protein [SAR324 cluster bacterium]
MQICAISFPGVKTINLRCVVFVGSAFENPQNSGISHFLEHMMFRGNKQLGNSHQLNLKMEEMGGDLNAVTSYDSTEYWLDYHIDYYELGLKHFCYFLQEPLFENLEIERSIILEELKADYNENNQLIDVDSINALELWPDHGLGLSVSGTRDSIENITSDDLTAWYEAYYQPGNMLLGVTGDIDLDKTIAFFSELFSQKAVSNRQHYPVIAQTTTNKQILLVDDKDNQFDLQWSFPHYPISSELRVHYQLIRRILNDGSSSRLQRLIREEKGLVYEISAEMLYFDNGATLSIHSLIGQNRLPELMTVLTDLIKELIKNGVSGEELNLAKRRFKIALDCNQDSAQGVLYEAMAPLIYPQLCPYNQVLGKLNAISLGEINATLRSLMQQDQTCFAMVGPSPEKHRHLLELLLNSWVRI